VQAEWRLPVAAKTQGQGTDTRLLPNVRARLDYWSASHGVSVYRQGAHCFGEDRMASRIVEGPQLSKLIGEGLGTAKASLLRAAAETPDAFHACRMLAALACDDSSRSVIDASAVAKALRFDPSSLGDWKAWLGIAEMRLADVVRNPDYADRIRDALLSELEPQHRAVLDVRSRWNPQTLAEVGASMGVVRERVRQIEARALSRALALGLDFISKSIVQHLPIEELPEVGTGAPKRADAHSEGGVEQPVSKVADLAILACAIMARKQVSRRECWQLVRAHNQSARLAQESVERNSRSSPMSGLLLVDRGHAASFSPLVFGEGMKLIAADADCWGVGNPESVVSETGLRVAFVLRNQTGVVSLRGIAGKLFESGEPLSRTVIRKIRAALLLPPWNRRVYLAPRLGVCGFGEAAPPERPDSPAQTDLSFGKWIPRMFGHETEDPEQATRIELLWSIVLESGVAGLPALRARYASRLGGTKSASVSYLLESPAFLQWVPGAIAAYDRDGGTVRAAQCFERTLSSEHVSQLLKHFAAGHHCDEFAGWMQMVATPDLCASRCRVRNQDLVRTGLRQIAREGRIDAELIAALPGIQSESQYPLDALSVSPIEVASVLVFTAKLGFLSKYLVNAVLGREVEDDSAISVVAALGSLGWIRIGVSWAGPHPINAEGLDAARSALLPAAPDTGVSAEFLSRYLSAVDLAVRTATRHEYPLWIDQARDELVRLVLALRAGSSRMNARGFRRVKAEVL
jgi:hypothetical protein